MTNEIPFDLPLAKLLAELSRRAYLAAPDQDHFGGAVTQETGTAILLDAPATDTQVLIQEFPDYIALAFRGTKQLRDWLTDLQIAKSPLVVKCDPEKSCGAGVTASAAQIHDGFLTAIDSILPQIIAHLLPPGADKSKMKPLIITGHSLGGALASLAGFFLEREGFPIQAVYTFASPRVGNAAFRTVYNSLLGFKTWRVVCVGDLVPLVPGIFTPPSDGYRHVGCEAFLDGITLRLEPSHYLEMALDGWRAYRAIARCDWDFVLQFHSITDDYQMLLNRIGRLAS